MDADQSVQQALESFHALAEGVITPHAVPDEAQAGLFTHFDAKKFLSNLHVVLSAVDPFIPAPVGPILTAIDGVLAKIDAGTASDK